MAFLIMYSTWES